MEKLNSKARVAEVGNTSARILALYTENAALQPDAYLKPLFGELRTLTESITEAIHKDKALSDLEDADTIRDSAIGDIFKIAEGYSVMRIDSLSTPAKKILGILDNFRGIAKENYTAESELIEAMLVDLSKLSAETAALVGLPEAIAFLRSSQDDFATKRQVYENSQVAQKQTGTAISLKKPILDLINLRLEPYLEAMKLANPTLFAVFADQVATAISTTNTAVTARSTKKKVLAP